MRRRLVVAFLLLTAVVLAALEVPLALGYAERQEEQLEARIQRDAFAIAAFAEDTLEGHGDVDLGEFAENYQARTGARVVITDADGVAVADSDPLRQDEVNRDFASREEFAEALAGNVATGVRSSETLGAELIYAAVPVASSGQVFGAVRVSYPLDEVDERVHRYWLALGGVAAISLLAAGLLAFLLARWVTQPLLDLEETAGSLGAGDLEARARIDRGPPEVRSLARSFNDTAARLAELVVAQEGFVADASHQLRTPLTALRLRLENLVDECPEPERDDLLAAQEEVGRLTRLVDGLLTLARAERLSAVATAEAVDLDGVLVERAGVWSPVADEQGVALRAEPGGLTVSATPDRLAQVIDNLVANALDACSEGAVVRLWAEAGRAGFVDLHVTDSGPGMTEEQRQHAFDRFWRAPGASDSGLGGTGLGLAICRKLIVADGGEIELGDAPGGGLDVVLRLPARP